MAVIDGTAGNDHIEGTSANDILRGFAGDDTLLGLGSNDILGGDAGNDFLDGGKGNNYILAGEGDDVIVDSGTGSAIDGGPGLDRLTLDRSAATANLSLTFRPVTGNNNVLSDGTSFHDVEILALLTGSGNDRVRFAALGPYAYSWNAGAGSDAITLDFADRADAVSLSSFSSGSFERRDVTAGATTVELRGVETVTVLGGSGDDRLTGSYGKAIFYGNAGDDLLHGTDGDDELDGGAGDDLLVARKGSNKVTGGAGDDTVRDEGSASTIDGGRGWDLLDIDRSALSADLTVVATRSNTLADGTTFVGFERLMLDTGSGNDRLTGGTGDDEMSSGAGNDVLNGRAGDDGLNGGTGKNRISGGDGDDSLNDEGSGSTIDGGAGHDFLRLVRSGLTAGVTFTLDTSAGVTNLLLPDRTRFRNVEALSLHTGSGDDRLTGADGDDTFLAGAGDDTLIGGAGHDWLDGGTGTNSLFGSAGDDALQDTGAGSTFDGGEGFDFARIERAGLTEDVALEFRPADGQVFTLPDGTTFVNVERLFLATGSGNDDVTYGGLALAPSREGGANYWWDAGAGDDHATVDFSHVEGRVTVQGSSVSANNGADLLPTLQTAQVMLSGVEHITVYGGDGNDQMTGGHTPDTFYGGGGNDTLEGNPGNDVLIGGVGDDTLIGGPGRDTYVFEAGGGHDLVGGFADGLDKLDVSAFGYQSLAELTAAGGSVVANGAGTLITFSASGETVRLDLVTPAQISDADFVFA